jgi:hypothetical protein
VINDRIALLDKFSSSQSDVYVLITTDENRLDYSAVLNCNDSDESGIGLTFSVKSGLSDDLVFSACLRKLICQSISEFGPLDLSGMIQLMVNSFLERIQAIQWCNASANSVFEWVHGQFQSSGFLKLLVPFEHQVLLSQQFSRFLDSLSELRIPLLPEGTSRQLPMGSTWPWCIRENASLKIDTFIVPISARFRESDFIEAMMNQVVPRTPPEEVEAGPRTAQEMPSEIMRLFSLFDHELL